MSGPTSKIWENHEARVLCSQCQLFTGIHVQLTHNLTLSNTLISIYSAVY